VPHCGILSRPTRLKESGLSRTTGHLRSFCYKHTHVSESDYGIRFTSTIMKILLGTKWEMTQVFTDDGRAHSATLVRVVPNEVTALRTKEKDGYEAVQVRAGKATREFRADKPGRKREITFAVGDMIDVSSFEEGEKITISAISKGKGFQGGVKRHGFHGASKTHGTKHAHRQPGSIGAGGVQKVLKGQKMAGRMGSDRVTIGGTRVVKIFPEEHMIAIKGGIPGNRGSVVEIRT